MDESELASKVLKYEQFVSETLKEDLRKVLDERDKIYSQLSDYLQLKTVIEQIQDKGLEKDGLKTQVDLGCNFYVQAKVPDASRIFVSVGFGFFVEFTLPEAIKFITKKTTRLTEQSKLLTRDAAKIKAHIKLVLEGLREIQGIDDNPQTEQRNIFL